MIKYLEYYKEKLPVRVGYSAIQAVKKETGVDFTDQESIEAGDLDLSVYELMLFTSLQSGHKGEMKTLPEEQRVPFKLKMEDMVDVLDECFMKFVAMIPTFFPEQELIPKKVKGNRQTKRKAERQKK